MEEGWASLVDLLYVWMDVGVLDVLFDDEGITDLEGKGRILIPESRKPREGVKRVVKHG